MITSRSGDKKETTAGKDGKRWEKVRVALKQIKDKQMMMLRLWFNLPSKKREREREEQVKVVEEMIGVKNANIVMMRVYNYMMANGR